MPLVKVLSYNKQLEMHNCVLENDVTAFVDLMMEPIMIKRDPYSLVGYTYKVGYLHAIEYVAMGVDPNPVQ